ncbi:MAG: nucleotidyltransferase domain-containing protein [Armatimonadota bacterium]
MRIRILERDGALVYQVVDRGDHTDETLASMLYQPSGATFERAYPPGLLFPHDRASLEARANRFLAREAQGAPTREAFESALERVCDRHREAGVEWWLAGSAALAVRGLDVRPHDIDVLTSLSQLERLVPVVEPEVVEPFHDSTGWVVRGFGVVDAGYRVDYAFDPEPWVDAAGPVDFGPTAAGSLEVVRWHGREIRVPPLALHVPSNRARGRDAVVAAIEARLR